MLIKLERLNYPVHAKASIDALWRALGTMGKRDVEEIIIDLKRSHVLVEISSRNFTTDRAAEFSKLFDFSIIETNPNSVKTFPARVAKPGTLKLYTVTVKVAFTARKPVSIHNSLVLASDDQVAQHQTLLALDLAPDEAIYDITVVEVKGPFRDGQVLTLNSKK